jgi:hypothetical protein
VPGTLTRAPKFHEQGGRRLAEETTVSTAREHAPTERPITRQGIETSIAIAWNAEGARRGLPPLAWRLGEPWEGIHFSGDADAYAPELRRDIVESWIAGLGLADAIDLTDGPLALRGRDMVWTGALDEVVFELRYPAAVDPAGPVEPAEPVEPAA